MIHASLLREFVASAEKALEGDWILIGGSLLPLLGLDYRVTHDIDIVKKGGAAGSDETLKLFDIAESLGLPVEAINQAAGYFLLKVPDYETRLETFHERKGFRLLIPRADLYVELKAARMSESDLADALRYLEHCRESGRSLDQARARQAVKSQLKSAGGERKKRLTVLLKALG